MDARLRTSSDALALTCMQLATGYHGTSIFTDQLYVSPLDQALFLRMHVVLLTAHLLWFVASARLKIPIRYYLWPLQVAFVAFLGYILSRTIARGETMDSVLAAGGLMVVSAVMLLFCPFYNKILAITSLVYMGVAAASVSANTEWTKRWLITHIAIQAATTFYQSSLVARARRQAFHEFRMLSLVAPRQVVRQATMPNATLETIFGLFAPTNRPVACISTDWRDYQRFSRSVEPEVLARNLNDYYDLCSTLLAQVCPEGNYYTDWIADELFIVIFGRPGGTTRGLVRQAVAFGDLLVKSKPKFLETHPMPQALDLGIAIGSAMVGMMGPKTHRKATALGEIPGLARRVQNCGKLLRVRMGDYDRVILHEYAVGWLKGDPKLRAYNLKPGDQLRDLEAKSVRFFSPGQSESFEQIELNDEAPVESSVESTVPVLAKVG